MILRYALRHAVNREMQERAYGLTNRTVDSEKEIIMVTSVF